MLALNGVKHSFLAWYSANTQHCSFPHPLWSTGGSTLLPASHPPPEEEGQKGNECEDAFRLFNSLLLGKKCSPCRTRIQSCYILGIKVWYTAISFLNTWQRVTKNNDFDSGCHHEDIIEVFVSFSHYKKDVLNSYRHGKNIYNCDLAGQSIVLHFRCLSSGRISGSHSDSSTTPTSTSKHRTGWICSPETVGKPMAWSGVKGDWNPPVGSTVVQWLALLFLSNKVLGSILTSAFLRGVCMLYLCLFPLGTSASSHSPKTWELSKQATLNCR